MAAQVLVKLTINTPCSSAICAVAPDLLDSHTSSRHQDFINSVYTGYLMRQRAADEVAELVYHQPPRSIESSQHIHNHISENYTHINRYYYYQQTPSLLSVNQQYAERLASISSTSKGRGKSNNKQLAVKTLPQIQLKSTLSRLIDNSKLLSLLQVSPATTERQTGIAKFKLNGVGQSKAAADSQTPQLAQIVRPLQVLWHSHSGQQVSRFLPLLRQVEQLASDLTAPQKLDAIIKRQISSNSLSHLSKRDKQLDDEKSQQQVRVLVSHPLILNTFNEKQQLQNTYLSRLPQRQFTGGLKVNAGTSANDNSLAQYQYNIQYHALRQNMPYSVSRGLAANMQASDSNQVGAFGQLGKYSDQQLLNQLNRYSAEQQLHNTHLSKLTILSLGLNPSLVSAAARLSGVRGSPHSKVQIRTLLQDLSYTQPRQSASAVPAQQISPATQQMPHSRANLVYTTKEKTGRSFSSSTGFPSAVSPSTTTKVTDGPIGPVTPPNAIQPAVASEQQNQQLSRRPQGMLSKIQTRQVADEVYQLINQRLRFEKRRRGLA